MSSHKRPTQADVARAAGVSRPTASLALKGSSVVSEATRAHVRKIADALGYAPDPMLSALAKYRSPGKTNLYQGTLAWVSVSSDEHPWDLITPYQQYYLGACKHAKRLGYKIECFDLHQEKLSAKRLDSILTARGINGILACPPSTYGSPVDLPWEKYHVVTFGYSINRPNVHRVSSSHYRATKMVFEKLLKFGYKRIGFVFSEQVNVKTQEHCLSAYLCESQKSGIKAPPPLVQDPLNSEHFEAWYKRYKPDAVIVSSPLWEMIQSTGIQVPKKLGVASPMVPERSPELTGIIEKCQEIGAAAIDTLVHMIQHDDKGLPNTPRFILLEGKWNPGRTTRKPQRLRSSRP
ncbi:MAG: LacI family DNA-binding transcriptional regulator [Puniceicoccales bacterium]